MIQNHHFDARYHGNGINSIFRCFKAENGEDAFVQEENVSMISEQTAG